jgi:signal transduction histidine kinase
LSGSGSCITDPEETGGVGLGLPIARTIADGHGGTLRFANRTEGGLQVTVTLPPER